MNEYFNITFCFHLNIVSTQLNSLQADNLQKIPKVSELNAYGADGHRQVRQSASTTKGTKPMFFLSFHFFSC